MPVVNIFKILQTVLTYAGHREAKQSSSSVLSNFWSQVYAEGLCFQLNKLLSPLFSGFGAEIVVVYSGLNPLVLYTFRISFALSILRFP